MCPRSVITLDKLHCRWNLKCYVQYNLWMLVCFITSIGILVKVVSKSALMSAQNKSESWLFYPICFCSSSRFSQLSVSSCTKSGCFVVVVTAVRYFLSPEILKVPYIWPVSVNCASRSACLYQDHFSLSSVLVSCCLRKSGAEYTQYYRQLILESIFCKCHLSNLTHFLEPDISRWTGKCCQLFFQNQANVDNFVLAQRQFKTSWGKLVICNMYTINVYIGVITWWF